MSMQHGKLTLEAIEGTHGDIAQRIALELVEAIEQRAELLEALKKILQNDGGNGSECFDALELHKGRQIGFAAINRAEAAE